MNKKEVFSKELYDELIDLIDTLEKKLHNPDTEKVYSLTRQLIDYSFSKICGHKGNIDNLMIISSLSKYLNKNTKKKIFSFFDYVDRLDYANFDVKKDNIIWVLEKFREILKIIFLGIKDYDSTQSKRLKKLKYFYNRIFFINSVEKLKKYQKYDIDLLIKINDYYDKMRKKDRDKYSAPFLYYSNHYPKMYELIDRLRNASNQEEKHNILLQLNKLYFKLKDKHKFEMSEKLKQIINNNEEKLNVYLMLGYNLIHEKDKDNLKKMISRIDKVYESLNDSLKEYYKEILERFKKQSDQIISK
ncbi:hypothetical protein C0585_01095 [Candidatus Woesearchaeota archaeon]|nr:MAG: hypothetical protein C0585_01095 [Candidatus Woesearchaeota archaeon]